MSNTDPSLLDTIKRRLSYTIPGYGAAKEIADVSGITPKVENAIGGAYDQFTKNGGLEGPSLNADQPEPLPPAADVAAQQNQDSERQTQHESDLAAVRAGKPPSTEVEDEADLADLNAKAHAQGGGSGHFGFSASAQGNPFEQQLAGDYNDQISGLEGEMNARQAYAQGHAQDLGNYANQERQFAQDSANQSQQTYQQALSHLDEIGQLASDYANQKIDPDKFWQEKSVPQKIATTIGAMLAGLQGGPKQAMEYVNNLVNRSIAVQQMQLQQKGKAYYQADNLYHNFLKTSNDELEAQDKTRAALLDAAMTDVARSSILMKGDVEQQQMRQFIAALKAQRDTILAKLKASASVSAGGGTAGPGASDGWLQTDGKNIIPGLDGQNYFIPNPNNGAFVANTLGAYKRMLGLVERGQEILAERAKINPVTSPYEYYQNLQQGHDLDGFMNESFSKLAQGRGVPEGVLRSIREVVPSFGSPLARLEASRLPEASSRIKQFATDILTQAGARPVDYTTGPGRGKHAGELENYVRPAQPRTQTPEAATVTGKQKYGSFSPGK